MMWWVTITDYIAEIIGAATILGLLAFIVTYRLYANWRSTRQGRAIMYMMQSLLATFLLLVAFTFWDEPREFRWVAELIVYLPLPFAIWNMYLSLVATLTGRPQFLFLVARKKRNLEDTMRLVPNINKSNKESVNMTNGDKLFGTIRTFTPSLVGGFIAWLVARIPAVGDWIAAVDAALAEGGFAGTTVEGILIALSMALFTAAYYWLIRTLSPRWPWLEAFLGSTKTPVFFAQADTKLISGAIPVVQEREAHATAGESVIVSRESDDTQPTK